MAQHIFPGTAAPAIAPTAIGQHFIDTVNKNSYISVGTSGPSDWKLTNDGGMGGVTSFNSRTGAVSPISGDYTAGQITFTPAGGISATDVQAALVELDSEKAPITHVGSNGVSQHAVADGTDAGFMSAADFTKLAGIQDGATQNQTDAFLLDRANHTGTQNISTIDGGNGDTLAYFDNTGVLSNLSGWTRNAYSGINQSLNQVPDGMSGGFDINFNLTRLIPNQDSPSETWHMYSNRVEFDPDNSGFEIGTGGQAWRFYINNAIHGGLADIGAIEFIQNNFSIGNGTDPIEFRGMGYLFGFGQINQNVTITGPLQGYGFQPHILPGAAWAPTGTYSTAFYDNANYEIDTPGHTSFQANPQIALIQNNHNYDGFHNNPTLTTEGNANVTGLGVYGNVTFDPAGNGSWQGVNMNPNVTGVRYAAGLNISMDNVTVQPGVNASLVIQDLTITADQPGSGANSVTFEYVGGGTAGSEIVSNIGLAFTVQIEDGVSTALQVEAALNGYLFFTTNLSVTVSGTGSNPQVIQAPTNLAGGVDAGRKLAAWLDGDVEITGSLTFGGSLAIGKLNAFHSQAIVDGGGAPTTIHQLISAPTVPASTTIANGDTLGVNTAMLLQMGDNAVVTSSFIGVAAMVLPAVVQMGTGATLDRLAAGLFALSLDAGATGGTIDKLDLCKSLVIPNGATTVNEVRGFNFDLPFGPVGTTIWGFYSAVAAAHNFFAGDLKIGGTDTPTNSSVALEIESTTKAFVNSRMTTAERDAMTAIAGMQIFNLDVNKHQGYDGTAWQDFY